MDIIKVDISKALIQKNEGAETKKQELLKLSAEITQVTTQEEQSAAVYRLRETKLWLKTVEKSRKDVKAPITELARKVDALADAHTKELDAECERINGMVDLFEEGKIRKAEEQERKRQEAIRKAEADAKAATELAALADKAVTSEDAGLNESDQAIMAQEMVDTAQANLDTLIRAPLAKIEKPAGLVAKRVVRWEITDERKLYDCVPHFFELVPRKRVINDTVTKDTVLPGLKCWEELDTTVRT